MQSLYMSSLSQDCSLDIEDKDKVEQTKTTLNGKIKLEAAMFGKEYVESQSRDKT